MFHSDRAVRPLIVASGYCCRSNVLHTAPLPGRHLPQLSGFSSAVTHGVQSDLLTEVKLLRSSQCASMIVCDC